MKKRFAAAGLAAGLTGGAIAGIALTHPSISGAQTDTTTPSTAPSSNGDQPAPERGAWIDEALAPLVANGTINQAQADAVKSALEAAKPPMGHGGPGFGGPGFGRGADLDAAATAIGISEDDLRTALQSGQSLAAIAQAHGKTAQDVIDALVADAKTHIDERVASGDITQAEADQKLADLTDRITAMVNGELPLRGPGGPGFRGGPPPASDSSSPTATGASTA